ncbi:putative Gpa2-guanine nucleotide-binding protein alpha-2 subunit [Syncephalis pseudoplumigaleata]|uniref:Putative Gpa2-guanine nucleotide-binding protein alpha-2 subunit n=1 Tax=Syncephalis pseudoplumigaleata TaxID=1712513 RepID=A0A4P9Z7D6_9FUNG|nr:putative Gpa2-guanine nucleotide-binding protein alpha-2 subunit [Syncephalis pseudoplumigaleata]|eukprot:RKP27811.1 putative Gpa2-guanine nucleotide-binding protein alpha-2 subunit [Syncephalis pseudoplumigaleata]
MGNCLASPEERHSRQIDRQIREDAKKSKTQVKLLLLGKCAGESGKSTILKQMRLIHAKGFTDLERESHRIVIFTNLLHSMRLLLEAMEREHVQFADASNMSYLSLFSQVPVIKRNEPYPHDYQVALRSLWADANVRACLIQANECAINDSAEYYFNDLDRLFAPGYIPTDQDILRCRVKTTGITETLFNVGALTYRMFDVGGQRSERKKWIHCFEDVTALLFLAAISGYDQVLVEDRDTNQMHEALMLFDSICNSQWFVHTSVILFLNKVDLFKKKIHYSPVSRYFPDFKGNMAGNDHDPSQTSVFFKRRFEALNRSPDKTVYSHFTHATDTKHISNIMNSVKDIILTDNLRELNF